MSLELLIILGALVVAGIIGYLYYRRDRVKDYAAPPPVMEIMEAGGPTNYWPVNYWPLKYWPDYGSASPPVVASRQDDLVVVWLVTRKRRR